MKLYENITLIVKRIKYKFKISTIPNARVEKRIAIFGKQLLLAKY